MSAYTPLDCHLSVSRTHPARVPAERDSSLGSRNVPEDVFSPSDLAVERRLSDLAVERLSQHQTFVNKEIWMTKELSGDSRRLSNEVSLPAY